MLVALTSSVGQRTLAGTSEQTCMLSSSATIRIGSPVVTSAAYRLFADGGSSRRISKPRYDIE
jgi:hypothetical protein